MKAVRVDIFSGLTLGGSFQSFTIKYDIQRFSTDTLISPHPSLVCWGVFTHKRVWDFIKCFLRNCWNHHVVFIFYSINKIYSLICMFRKVCILGINCTQSWYIILLICWSRFISVEDFNAFINYGSWFVVLFWCICLVVVSGEHWTFRMS